MVFWFFIGKYHKYFCPSNDKMDHLYHTFNKENKFETTVTLPPSVTTIGVFAQYCDHQNMYYVSRSKNYSQWNRVFPERNRANSQIIRMIRIEPTIV